MGFQSGIRLAFGGIEQRLQGGERLGNALPGGADGFLGLLAVRVDQQLTGVAPVIAHARGGSP
jgi:hypothetical protein